MHDSVVDKKKTSKIIIIVAFREKKLYHSFLMWKE